MAFTLLPSNQLKRNEMIILCTTLSWMVESGLSVRDGVQELLNDKNNKMNKKALTILRDELDDGKILSQILKDNENIFGSGWWRQVDAAERTGKLPDCLNRIAEQLRTNGDLLGKVRGALVYPVVILIIAAAAGAYMFTNVVPEMGEMMAEFDVELPALTVAVMGIADFLIANGLWMAMAIVVFIVIVRYLLTKTFQMQWHHAITKMPVVGNVSVFINYSLAYNLLNDMIENGSNIVEAMMVAAESVGNVFIKKELVNTADRMTTEGLGLTDGLTATDTMPSEDKLMLTIGQKTGREMELLPDLSKRRRKAAYEAVDHVMELLPTFVLLGVSGIVAVMVISIYMPMITMATEIG